jgi:hypothetical protein
VIDLEEAVTPQFVTDWARELPYTNLAVCGREAFSLLEKLKGTVLTPTDRSAINRTLATPTGLILDYLEEKIIIGHCAAERLGDLVVEICLLMATTYEAVVSSSVARLSITLVQRVSTAKALAIAYLGRAIVFDAMSYRAIRGNTWGRRCRSRIVPHWSSSPR